jgi:hypothetical protein
LELGGSYLQTPELRLHFSGIAALRYFQVGCFEFYLTALDGRPAITSLKRTVAYSKSLCPVTRAGLVLFWENRYSVNRGMFKFLFNNGRETFFKTEHCGAGSAVTVAAIEGKLLKR